MKEVLFVCLGVLVGVIGGVRLERYAAGPRRLAMQSHADQLTTELTDTWDAIDQCERELDAARDSWGLARAWMFDATREADACVLHLERHCDTLSWESPQVDLSSGLR